MKCKYCGGAATYPPKTRWSGWCCVERYNDCPGYRKKLGKGSTKETNSRILERSLKLKCRKLGSFVKHTNESRAKISESMRGNNNAKHRGDRQSYYKGIRMDSSWEVKVAAYLDEHGIKWTYGEKVFVLSSNRSYRPDFVLECGKIIEVKGYWRKANLEKFTLWRQLYPDVVCEIWDKTKLKELGLI